MPIISIAAAKSLTAHAVSVKDLLTSLSDRIRATALNGQDRMVVQFGSSLDVPTECKALRGRTPPSNSMRLRGEMLVEVLRASTNETANIHATVMEHLHYNGFLVEAECTKANWADPLQLAPVLDCWRISWAAPGEAIKTSNTFGGITADEASSLLDLPRKVAKAMDKVSERVETAARSGSSRAYIHVGDEWSREVTSGLCDELKKAGYVASYEREGDTLTVCWV